MQYLFIFLFALSGVFLSCNSQCSNGVYELGVEVPEQRYIVNAHNTLREMLARNEVPGQPRAINLKRLSWDNYLARAAQNIANSCLYGHQGVPDNRWAVGQNIATTKSTNYVPNANWTATIYSWWDEHNVYHYPDASSQATGHYTQMAWADTQYVGCGYTHYPISGRFQYQKFYVCNYGPAGNYPTAPYQSG